jgi:hypothetical protein
MWRLFKKKVQTLPEAPDGEKQERLDSAEKRANVLYARAEWLHAVVVARDAQNHWQESVNSLFWEGRR